MGQMISLNRWYESLPETRRMLVIPAILIVVGGINMAMTIGNGFPFGLLFLIALLVILALRAPYAWGFVRDPAGHATAAPDQGLPDLSPHLQIEADWLYDANLKYNALPETTRMMVIPLFLAVVGGINMSLTIGTGFPFGLLFLLGVIAVVGFRLPFEAGWLKQPGERRAAVTPSGSAVASGPRPGPGPAIAPAPATGALQPPDAPYEQSGSMLHERPEPEPAVRHVMARGPAPEAVTQSTPPVAPPHDPAPPADPTLPPTIPPHDD